MGILEVAPDSPAAQAGVKVGDFITRIDGQDVASIDHAREITQIKGGQPTIYTIKHGDDFVEKTIIPRANPPEGQGPLGVALGSVGFVSYPWYKAIILGITSTVILCG